MLRTLSSTGAGQVRACIAHSQGYVDMHADRPDGARKNNNKVETWRGPSLSDSASTCCKQGGHWLTSRNKSWAWSRWPDRNRAVAIWL